VQLKEFLVALWSYHGTFQINTFSANAVSTSVIANAHNGLFPVYCKALVDTFECENVIC